ncbi:MAG: hypothetical protein ACI4IK_02875 [Eubacterium sp.]
MKEFIKVQYKLYLSGSNSIGIDKIRKLADKFMSVEEIKELFGGEKS